MSSRRSAPHPLRPLPQLLASLRALGLDLRDPAMTTAFVAGVRVAEDAIDAEAHWMRARCKPVAAPRRG